jgi:hypothetical protein
MPYKGSSTDIFHNVSGWSSSFVVYVGKLLAKMTNPELLKRPVFSLVGLKLSHLKELTLVRNHLHVLPVIRIWKLQKSEYLQ